MKALSPLTLVSMDIAEDAAAPIPTGGAGSAAWSTRLTAPVFWDGSAWRTVGHFAVPAEIPAWVPANALLVADFENGQYWRQDIGVCQLDDVAVYDANWGAFDPQTDIVPGTGLTTGDVSPVGHYARGFLLPQPAYTLVQNDGLAATFDFDISASAPFAGDGYTVVQAALYDMFDYNQSLLFNAYKNSAGNHVRGESSSYGYVGEGYDVGDTIVSEPFVRMAASLDMISCEVLLSHNGNSLDSAVFVGPRDAINGFGASVYVYMPGGQPYTSRATMKRMVLYPKMNQASLNALTATTPPAIDFDLTTTLSAELALTRASSGTFFDGTGVLRNAATDVARFDYDPASLAGPWLLYEPAATNQLPYSNGYAGWSTNNISYASGTGAPDGTTNATTLTDNATLTGHILIYHPTYAGGIVTLSAYIKAGTLGFAGLLIRSSSTVRYSVLIDLNDGSFADDSVGASTTDTGYTIEDAGNGFYRLSVTATMSAATIDVGCFGADSAAPAWDGDGNPQYSGASDTWTVWGFQLEDGGKSTSLIQTAGSTGTRAADALSFTVPTGVTSLRYTFDDDSTQDVSVSVGAYNVPTNLDRARIKRIVSL